MNGKGLSIGIVLLWFCHCVTAQVSTDCATAIPICSNTPVNGGTQGFGQDDFQGAMTSGCLEQSLSGAIESNSAWYRFRTAEAGQLGFTIGADAEEDWDFALYRSSDCNALGEPVRCNFFDNSEQEVYTGVGTPPTGAGSSVLFEEWLEVLPGEDYFLLINNFSNTNTGFSVQFTGQIFQDHPGTALDCSIVSNLLGPPIAACEGDPPTLDATVPNALTYTWYRDDGNGFQVISGASGPDYQPTLSGMYRVEVTTSMETLYSDVQVGFSAVPVTHELSDEIRCGLSDGFDFRTKDAEALGDQNPDAFTVSYHLSAEQAAQGEHALPELFSPAIGTQTIYVRLTTVGNSACYDASRSFTLTTIEPPLADFQTEVVICSGSEAVIGDETPQNGYTYHWNTGAQTPSLTVSAGGEFQLTATSVVPGASCSTTWTIRVTESSIPQISEVLISDLSQNNTVEVRTVGAGPYLYRLDEGPTQDHGLFSHVEPGFHIIRIHDPNGCGSVSESITVVGFPKFFTPNGDGQNDLWRIRGIELLTEPEVFIFDRFGKLVGQLLPEDAGWDGTYLGVALPASDYWFRLTYLDIQGQRVPARYIANHFSLKR